MCFYRLVDGIQDDSPDCKELRTIERNLFDTIKPELVAKETWTGSYEQNKKADFKISDLVRNAFRAEENKKNKTASFFKF